MNIRTLTVEITQLSNGQIHAEVRSEEDFGVIERTAAARAILEGIPQEVLNIQFCDRPDAPQEMRE